MAASEESDLRATLQSPIYVIEWQTKLSSVVRANRGEALVGVAILTERLGGDYGRRLAKPENPLTPSASTHRSPRAIRKQLVQIAGHSVSLSLSVALRSLPPSGCGS